jgi:glucose/arabinose dehydrogenase
MRRGQHSSGILAGLVGLALVAACAAPDRPVSTPSQPLGASTAPASLPTSPAPATPNPSTSASEPPGAAPHLGLENVVSGLQSPLDIAWRPDDPATIFVAEQGGQVRIVREGKVVGTPFLDIRGLVTAAGEQGLLGLAFHPDPSDPRFFVYYTALDGQEILASYTTLSNDRDRADPDSARVLLQMDDPFPNHNGGGLAFGPDGYLYISTGDGGGGGDPLDSGRHLDTLLAKILRIDVNAQGTGAVRYGIPQDNPFLEVTGARPEIWLSGLRNPWRIRFDRATGDLWIGDVGQNEREEIDVARAGIGGLDFGWNIMEGTFCFRDGGTNCLTDDLTLPVTEYGHDQGCSVIGGTVYRGERQPGLRGWYVLSDNCSGRFWVLDPDRDDLRAPTFALDSHRSISAIGEDASGELYATDLAGGELLRIVAEGG